jgi:hypothetical protein
MSTGDLATIEFTEEEQKFLTWGMAVWHGASHPSSKMRHALGFENYADIFPWTNDKMHAIGPVMEMTRADWTQFITLVEVGFASDNAGAGLEWSPISGIPDSQSIRILRAIQRKLLAVVLRNQ